MEILERARQSCETRLSANQKLSGARNAHITVAREEMIRLDVLIAGEKEDLKGRVDMPRTVMRGEKVSDARKIQLRKLRRQLGFGRERLEGYEINLASLERRQSRLLAKPKSPRKPVKQFREKRRLAKEWSTLHEPVDADVDPISIGMREEVTAIQEEQMAAQAEIERLQREAREELEVEMHAAHKVYKRELRAYDPGREAREELAVLEAKYDHGRYIPELDPVPNPFGVDPSNPAACRRWVAEHLAAVSAGRTPLPDPNFLPYIGADLADVLVTADAGHAYA